MGTVSSTKLITICVLATAVGSAIAGPMMVMQKPLSEVSATKRSVETNCFNTDCTETVCENGDCKVRSFKRELPHPQAAAELTQHQPRDAFRSLLGSLFGSNGLAKRDSDSSPANAGPRSAPSSASPMILFGTGLFDGLDESNEKQLKADPSKLEIAPIDSEKSEEDAKTDIGGSNGASKASSALEKLFSHIFSAVREYRVHCKNGVCTTSMCKNGACEEKYSIEKSNPDATTTSAPAAAGLENSPASSAAQHSPLAMPFGDLFNPTHVFRPWYQMGSKADESRRLAINVKTTRITCVNGDCKTEVCDQNGCKPQEGASGSSSGSPIDSIIGAIANHVVQQQQQPPEAQQEQLEQHRHPGIPAELPMIENEIMSNEIPRLVADEQKKANDIVVDVPARSAPIQPLMLRPTRGFFGPTSPEFDRSFERLFRHRMF